MAPKQKPTFTLARPVSKDLIELYTKLTGKRPTPEELARLKPQMDALDAEFNQEPS